MASYKLLSALSNAELERRLLEEPDSIATRDLTVLSGVSADEAARYEGWGKPEEEDRSAVVARMFDRLERMFVDGHSFRLEVSPPAVDAQAIDVKPTGARVASR